MRTSLFVAILATLFLTVACSKKNKQRADDGEPLSGERVFARQCASCHGPAGEGDGPMSPTFAHVSDLTDQNVQEKHSDDDLRTIITKGYKRMPPVRNLSDAELDALIGHVRVLGGQNAEEDAPDDVEDVNTGGDDEEPQVDGEETSDEPNGDAL